MRYELRLGNYVIEDGEITTFDGDFYHWIDDLIQPIPLTEEWLFKFGFVKKDFGLRVDYYANTKALWKIKFINNVYKRDRIEIKHVHQLQNLYFALTGHELKTEEL